MGCRIKKTMKNFIKASKEKLNQWKKPLVISSIALALGVVGYFVYQSGFSYQVKLNGQDIGFVKEIELIDEALVLAEQGVNEEYGEKAYFHQEIDTERVRGHNDDIVGSLELKDNIIKNSQVLKPASIILVDGEEEVIVDSSEDADIVLEEIKKPYIRDTEEEEDKNIEVVEVSFNQEVEIISKDVPVDEIIPNENAVKYLSAKEDEIETYKVAKGDSAWDISRSLNIGIRNLEKANPEKDIEQLKPGEEINISVPKSMIEVVSIEKHKSKEDIDFEVKEKDDNSIYEGEKKTDQEGEKGKKEITTEITYINGVETGKDVVKEKTVKDAVNKVVLVGTKERPKPVMATAAASTTRQSTSRSRQSTSRASQPTSVASQPTSVASKGKAAPSARGSIVATARQFLGVPYVSGGSTPSGFDCSGFTQYVYRLHGINIPRTSGDQASVGAHIPKSQLQAGDIVAFSGHVGIYVGNGNIIHASSSKRQIHIGPMKYVSEFIGGRRPY